MKCPKCMSNAEKIEDIKIKGRLNTFKGVKFVTNLATGDWVNDKMNYPEYECTKVKCSYKKCGAITYIVE